MVRDFLGFCTSSSLNVSRTCCQYCSQIGVVTKKEDASIQVLSTSKLFSKEALGEGGDEADLDEQTDDGLDGGEPR